MLKDIINIRKQKIEELKKTGINPYPEKVKRDFSISEILKNFNSFSKKGKKIYVVGRILALRDHKDIFFADICDMSGKIQIILKKDSLKNKALDFFRKFFDIGDFIEVKGKAVKSQTKEKSILVEEYRLIAKSLRPIPSVWYGLEDVEERFRKRYLDLLMNPEVKERFLLRSEIISLIREFLNNLGFIEVETPILQTVYGGANAQPFKTHLEYLNLDLYLRIAPELYLKRLIIGGFEKIYEIGRCFRNEGIDREHNPEFSLLELYSAYSSREDLMELIEDMFRFLAKKLRKKLLHLSDLFKRKWPRIKYEDFLKKKTGLGFDEDLDLWLKKARELEIELEKKDIKKEKIFELIFKKYRREIKEPTYIIDHPVEISPLAKRKEDSPNLVSRFQLIVNGWELVNGFSELNDPLDQRERFLKQEEMRQKGDLEAHPQDEEFLEALEYGMPPTAGLGIGIDRLVAVLTEAPSLKEVIFFPFMKPKKE
jgi:lysyl-tRNA synthetase class 2